MTPRFVRTALRKGLRREISELPSRESMLNKGTASYPMISVALRDVVQDREVQLCVHPKHRAFYTIETAVYAEKEENETAIGSHNES